MNAMVPRTLVGVVALCVSLCGGSAYAGPVAPGQELVLSPGDEAAELFRLDPDSPDLAGEVLAELSAPYEFMAIDSEDPTRVGLSRGTVTNRVVRESATGRLAFHYLIVQAESQEVVDLVGTQFNGLGQFETDLLLRRAVSSTAVISRSADGDEIAIGSDLEQVGEWAVVRTDATAFEPGGSVTYAYSFPALDGPGESGSVTFAAFRPADAAAVIPLPPAAWTGLSALLLLGSVRPLARVLRRVPAP